MKIEMRAAMLCLVIFLLSIALTACENKPVPKSSGQNDELLEVINEAEFRIQSGSLLTRASAEEKRAVLTGLRRIQGGLMQLNAGRDNASAIEQIDVGMRLLNRFETSERNAPTLTEIVARAGRKAYPIATQLGLQLTQPWRVYVTEFSQPLQQMDYTQFWSPSSVRPWEPGLALNGLLQRVKVRSTPFGRFQLEKAWLLTPAMSFEQLEQAAFRIQYSLDVQSGPNADVNFDIRNYQRKAIKVKISTTYDASTTPPWEMEDCEWVEDEATGQPRLQVLGKECDWMSHDVDSLNVKTSDFFTTFSPKVDLSQYRGKNVTLAFVVDMTPIVYDLSSCDGGYLYSNRCRRKLPRREQIPIIGHEVNWEIHSFEIFGIGLLDFPKGARRADLFEHNFGQVPGRIQKHTQIKAKKNGFDWEADGHPFDQDRKWAITRSFDDRHSSVGLISETYDISEVEDLKAGFQETMSFWRCPRDDTPKVCESEDINLVDLGMGSVLYSYDYTGGDVTQANWYRVKRKQPPEKWMKQFNNNNISDVVLNSSTGTVTFLFWYKHDTYGLWQLENYTLSGRGTEIKALENRPAPKLCDLNWPPEELLDPDTAPQGPEGLEQFQRSVSSFSACPEPEPRKEVEE